MQPKVGTGWGLPEGNDRWSDWTWFHARAEHPQRFTVLCSMPVNYAGHFHKGRMLPCHGDGCPLCAKGEGTQARYVVSVVDWETRKVGLLELGRGHALTLQDWAGANGGLRGVSFEIERSCRSKHSRLDMRLVTDASPVFIHHLEGPDLVRAVKSTWQRQASQLVSEDPCGEVAPARRTSPAGRGERRIA